MGKVNNLLLEDLVLTPLQKFILTEFAKNNKLIKQFYFTGGTALSSAYLKHRDSEDLDFFSETDFDKDIPDRFIQKIAAFKKLQIRLTQREYTRIYELLRANKVEIKVDFAYYPYKRLKKGLTVSGIQVDSLFDIAANKLQTIVNRNEVKDFIDLYFLLKEFTLWDLIYAVKEKFRIELDLIWLGSDFLKVEKFEDLPKMLVPLSLKELQEFYKEKAKQLGMSVVKK
ncbi:nucleotidyl transferase AbiEii/AbiGii toxin family protein [Candidatus Daviesbacteria bacterium]|nr:nucleotidyl transferase AbiEii/AbiGii toxin family protein [Candidatus Daviesbacteria bacterium]